MASHDYEVRLATLAERARIAREIHDNVGHLLTRSVLQVEALQVVHAEDEQVRADLAQVGATLHEAMDTVRKSVHDLHDDAFDLRSRLESVVGACGLPGARLSFDARDVPVPVAYCFVALVREALSTSCATATPRAQTYRWSNTGVLPARRAGRRLGGRSVRDGGSPSGRRERPRAEIDGGARGGLGRPAARRVSGGTGVSRVRHRAEGGESL